jgi:protein TonB
MEFRPIPPYPELARKRGWQGKTIFEVATNEEGSVTEARLKVSSGYAVLDQAALETVLRWKMKPSAQYVVPILFRLMAPETASPSPPL